MGICLDDDGAIGEFMTVLERVVSGNEKVQHYQDYLIQVGQDGHPLTDLVDKSLLTSPFILISSTVARERISSTASVGESDVSVESVEGSPLRLQTFTTPEILRQSGGTRTKSDEAPLWPVTAHDARGITSLVNLYLTSKLPVCVVCDGRDVEGTAVMCSLKKQTENERTQYHQTVAKMTGPLTGRCKYPTEEELLRDLDIDYMNLVESRCRCSYDIYKSSQELEDGTLPEHQGSLRLLFEWKKVTQPLQAPPKDATTLVEAQVVAGDMRSAAHSLYSDVILLKGLIGGLKNGIVYWNSAASDVPVHDKLQAFISRSSSGPEVEKEEDDSLSPIENLIMVRRKNLDFTEMLWDILKDCQCYQELIDCLQVVIKALKSGNLQPVVHSVNQSQLARLVRQIYMGEMKTVSLTHPTPLHILAEIGLDKLAKDHAHHLISKELVTMAQVEPYISGEGELEERLVQLEKLHVALEMAVTLDQVLKLPKLAMSYGARQALKHFEKNQVGEKPHTFLIPIQAGSVSAIISQLKPSDWHVQLTSKRNGLKEHAAYHLTPQPPFTHPLPLNTHQDEVDSVYYQTTISHQIIEM